MFVLLYGLGPLPAAVRVPIWLGVSIVALIGVPFFYLIGVAFVHLVRADRALRRQAKDGQVFYPNRIAQWVYVHGLAIGLAVVGLLVTASSWWALHQTR